LLPALRRKGVSLLAITGRPESTLAREADWHLDAAVERLREVLDEVDGEHRGRE